MQLQSNMKLNQHKDNNLLLEAQESTSLETSNTTNFHEERNLSLNTQCHHIIRFCRSIHHSHQREKRNYFDNITLSILHEIEVVVHGHAIRKF